MTERKSGPVKPPVIDLTARDTTPPPDQDFSSQTAGEAGADAAVEGDRAHDDGGAFPADGPAGAFAGEDGAVDREAPDSAKFAAALRERRSSIWPAAVAGSIGGAVLGTALTYGLMSSGLLPLPPDGAGARIEELGQRVAALETAPAEPVDLSAIEQRIGQVEADLGQRIAEVDSAFAEQQAGAVDLAPLTARVEELRGRVDALQRPAMQAANAAVTPEQLAQLQQGLTQLQQQVAGFDARATGNASNADALSQSVAALEQSVAALQEQVGSLDSRLAENQSALQSAGTQIAETQAGLAELSQSAATASSPVVQLPLVLSGLEDGIASGRPFAAEIESIRTILPEQDVPLPVLEKAETGLMPPEVLNQRFEEILPEMLAARPSDPDAGPLQSTLDWGKSMLAIRPAQEIPGTSPEALISRFEAALGRRDYVTASEIFAQLPEPMKAPAGELQAELAAHAAAESFITALRANALAQRPEPSP